MLPNRGDGKNKIDSPLESSERAKKVTDSDKSGAGTEEIYKEIYFDYLLFLSAQEAPKIRER